MANRIRGICIAAVAAILLFLPAISFAEEIEEVQLSSDGSAAALTDVSFALDNFTRAQVGSNKTFDGVYKGYSYYIEAQPGLLVAIATRDYIVVYVPSFAAQVGFNKEDEVDESSLKKLLTGLDSVASKGNSSISDDTVWYFTEETTLQVGGVLFLFDQEHKPGQFYASIRGLDGSDITVPSNPAFVQLTNADSASFVSANEVGIIAPITGFDAMVQFLQAVDYSPLWVTLKTTGTAIVFIFILGLAAAYFSLRIPGRARDVADAIFTIPMVLPPTVCGFLLLLLFGKNTPLGQWFIDIGFPLIFSWQATVIAAVVVAFPLMYRSARGAFENLDANMLDAARTLGWSNRRIFFKLMLPLSWSSVAAGTVLAFARALGEFGATLFLAGNFLGITRTIPIAIYFEWMNGNIEVAIFWTVIIIIFSFIVIVFINLYGRRTTKYRRGIEE